MSDPDLDALERRYPIEREYANLTDAEFRTLIQRLREAEPRSAEYLKVGEILQARGGWSGFISQSEAVNGLFDDLDTLERVREAAIAVVVETDSIQPNDGTWANVEELRAALATAEENS